MLQKADSWKLSASQTWLSQFFLSFLIFLYKNTNWHFYGVFNLKSFYESTSEERYRMSLRGQVRKHGRNPVVFHKRYCILLHIWYNPLLKKKKRIFCRISITKTITIIIYFAYVTKHAHCPYTGKELLWFWEKSPYKNKRSPVPMESVVNELNYFFFLSLYPVCNLYIIM